MTDVDDMGAARAGNPGRFCGLALEWGIVPDKETGRADDRAGAEVLCVGYEKVGANSDVPLNVGVCVKGID